MHALFVLAFYHVTSSTALTTPQVASIPNGNTLAPPPPQAGESVDQWLDQLFGPMDDSRSNSTNDTLSARSNAHIKKRDESAGEYRQYNGIHELTWTNETTKSNYNLTMDVSKSCTGLNLSSEIGVYTFTNGTTAAGTQLKDIISDVWSLAPTPADRRRRWANHTAVVAQMALNEADQVLNSALICQNKTATEILAKAASGNLDLNPVHDELRHLLSASAWSYWTATIVSTIIGAAIGASVAAGVQHHFTGNVTAQNVVQTAAVVGATVLIGGILMRLHENGRLDSLAEVAAKKTLKGRQVVLEQTHIARWRELIVEVRRQSTDRLWDTAASRDVAGYSIDGQTSPGSLAGFSNVGGHSTPLGMGTPRKSSSNYVCLSDSEAVDAMRALGQMSSDEMRLKMMKTINEYELERAENGELDSLRTEDWAFCQQPRGSSEASPLESAEPSFQTANGRGEPSAADLVALDTGGTGDSADTENTGASGSGGGENGNRAAGEPHDVDLDSAADSYESEENGAIPNGKGKGKARIPGSG